MTIPLLRMKLEQHLDELPLLPSAVTSLMSLDRQSEKYFEQVLKLVESEPNFSARLLVAANSVGLASSTPITTLRAAIARTGSQRASGLVLGLAVARVFIPSNDWEKSLWRHAIQVAVASRELARLSASLAVNAEEAYTAGLLHDVGRFVMFQEAPEQLRLVDEGGWDDPQGLIATELAICGLTHAELGAKACSKWGIPELITQTVRHHHDRELAGLAPEVLNLVAVVRAADLAMFPSAMPGAPGMHEADDDTLRNKLLLRLPQQLRMELQELRALLTSAAGESATAIEGLGLS